MKTKHTTPITVITAMFLALASSTIAADSKVNAADEKFIKQTGESGMAEVQIATLGSKKAERSDVKDFASMLVTDHTALNAELATLAESKNVELSAVITPKGADKFKALEKESGKDFDNAFLAHMEECHEKSVAAFEEAKKNAGDGELKTWVTNTLPKLKEHLEKVRTLRERK